MRYGLLTTLRTPLKTFTFFLLIAVMTMFLSLGFGMWQSAENMLDEADVTFTTAGEFIYNRGGYPDTLYYDKGLAEVRAQFDLDGLNRKEVLLAEDNITQRVYLEGYSQTKDNMPFEKYAVLTVTIQGYYEAASWIGVPENLRIKERDPYDMRPETGIVAKTGAYRALVTETLYSSKELDNKLIYIFPESGESDFVPGREYMILVAAYERYGRVDCNATSFDTLEFIENTNAYPSVTALSSDTGKNLDVPNGIREFYNEVAQALAVVNNSIDVVATKNAELNSVFHGGRYTLTEGRFFNDADENVCIIPQAMASGMNLSLGDTIDLSFHYPTDQTGRYSSYWGTTGFAAENVEHTVIGIYLTNKDNTPVYIPNYGQAWLGHSANDYVLARVQINNRTVENYLTGIKDLLPSGVIFNPYDQGYKAAVMPINGMRETSALIIGLCLAVCILVFYFFGYLFVYRNERNARILLVLGAGAKRVYMFYLSGALAIAALSSLIGSVGGYFVSKFIFTKVYDAAIANASYDFRFSSSGVSNDIFSARPEVSFIVYILIAAAVTVAVLLFCTFFASRVIRSQNPQYRFRMSRKTETAKKPKEPKSAAGAKLAMVLPLVSLRYAVRSVLRGGKRSLVVPVLFAGMVLFICAFYNMRTSFEEQMEETYLDYPLLMRYCDITGKVFDGFGYPYYSGDEAITGTEVLEVIDTGFVYITYPTNMHNHIFLGVKTDADGNEPSPERAVKDFVRHETKEEREAFAGQFHTIAEKIIYTDRSQLAFDYAPEFAFGAAPKITWFKNYGFDGEYFTEYPMWRMIIVSEAYLEKYNVALGETITIQHWPNMEVYVEGTVDFNTSGYFNKENMFIAGSFVNESNTPAVYYCEGYPGGDLEQFPYRSYFDSVAFHLKNKRQLSEFKDWLEENFNPVGVEGEHNRWVVIDDAAFYAVIDSLNRYIGYINIFYPIIMGMVVGVGFLVSHLLLKSRTGEIAVLRGLGTRKRTLFFAYFDEQFILSLIGTVIGLGIAIPVLGGFSAINPLNVLLLCGCYYAGLAIAIIQTSRKAAMASLAAKDE